MQGGEVENTLSLKIGVLNVRGYNSMQKQREEIGRMCIDRKLDVHVLRETKLKGSSECECGCVNSRKLRVEKWYRDQGRAKEGMALLLSAEVC